MTPWSKKIYDSASEAEKTRLLEDFKADNEIIDIINKKQDEEDKDYIYDDDRPGTIGFYLEGWVSLNYKCPICNKKSLKPFVLPNMPVVDLICNNSNHTIEHGVKFFQVKSSSNNGSISKKSYIPYFSNDQTIEDDKKTKYKGFIHVGSIRYGYNAHNIKTTDPDDIKKILVGYICLKYDITGTDDKKTININKDSFVLLPKINCTIDNILYYKYIEKSKQTIITWDDRCVETRVFPHIGSEVDITIIYQPKHLVIIQIC